MVQMLDWVSFLKDKICTLHFEACKHLPYPHPAQTPSPLCELQLWMIVVHAVVKVIHTKYYKNLKKPDLQMHLGS